MSTEKLSVEQKVQKDHVWLMRSSKYCLYSGIIMLGKTEVKDDVPTAYTDGRDVVYGRKFMQRLSDKERRGVILHENMHKAFRHLSVWRHLYEKDQQLANMACDFVINLLIHDKDSGVTLPDFALLDDKYAGMDAGQVYRLLKQEAQQNNSIHIKTVGNQQGKHVPVQHCGSMDEHGWDDAQGMSDEEREVLARDIDQALRQGALLASKMGGNVPREVADLLTPKVDWREALREFITSLCQDKDTSTWRKPSRRWVDQNIYMPSSIGEAVGRVVLAIDTSGSIDAKQIGTFLTEVRSICETVRPEGIDLLYWDSRVRQHEKYEQDQLDNLLSSTKPRGGGGTAPSCVSAYITSHKIKAECVVVLTDGIVAGDWGSKWTCPVLWGITTGEIAGVGKTIHIEQ